MWFLVCGVGGPAVLHRSLHPVLSAPVGGPHVGHHVGPECAAAAGAHPEPVGAGAGEAAGGRPVPPGREGPGLQGQHPKRYRTDCVHFPCFPSGQRL